MTSTREYLLYWIIGRHPLIVVYKASCLFHFVRIFAAVDQASHRISFRLPGGLVVLLIGSLQIECNILPAKLLH
jgi:hypothetical protein